MPEKKTKTVTTIKKKETSTPVKKTANKKAITTKPKTPKNATTKPKATKKVSKKETISTDFFEQPTVNGVTQENIENFSTIIPPIKSTINHKKQLNSSLLDAIDDELDNAEHEYVEDFDDESALNEDFVEDELPEVNELTALDSEDIEELTVDGESIEYAEEFEKSIATPVVDEINRNNEEVLKYLHDNRDKLSQNEIDMIYADFFNKNMKIIYYVISKHPKYYVSDETELFSMGSLGFAKALDKYNPNIGAKFTTFAIHCIKNEINFMSRKEKKHFDNNISLSYSRTQDKNGKDLTLEDTVADPSLNPEEQYREGERNELIRASLNDLTPFEKYIIVTRYGFDRNKKFTQKDIANITNMSQANISKIEKVCIEKLKEKFETLLH